MVGRPGGRQIAEAKTGARRCWLKPWSRCPLWAYRACRINSPSISNRFMMFAETTVLVIGAGPTGLLLASELLAGMCQSASNRDPGSACKKDPSPALGQACPGSEQEGPARVAQCPHERRSDARGRCLFAHRGKPGWHSRAVFETPALVAGFDDFAMMG